VDPVDDTVFALGAAFAVSAAGWSPIASPTFLPTFSAAFSAAFCLIRSFRLPNCASAVRLTPSEAAAASTSATAREE
jgi:hypothetical protein